MSLRFLEVDLTSSKGELLARAVTRDDLAAAHPLWAGDLRVWAGDLREPGEDADILVTGPASSALDVAWELERRGEATPFAAVLVLSQSRGRGQVRRPWSSPPGGHYGVFRLEPVPAPHHEGLSPLLTSLAVLRALDGLDGGETFLKWPNDIIVKRDGPNGPNGPNGPDGSYAKVGGILVEERSQGRSTRLVAGVGLNLVEPPSAGPLGGESPPPLPPGQLSLARGPLLLCAAITRNLDALWRELSGLSRAGVLGLLEARLAWRGERVRVLGAGRQEGTGATDPQSDFDKMGMHVVGLEVDGALRLADPSGAGPSFVLSSGSVRPA